MSEKVLHEAPVKKRFPQDHSVDPPSKDGKKGSEKVYSLPNAHLGQIMHSIVEARLLSNGQLDFGEHNGYTLHLDDIVGNGVGTLIQDKLEAYAPIFEKQIIEQVNAGEGEEIVWFSEVQFEPSMDQVKVISDFKNNPDMKRLIVEWGYEGMGDFAVAILTDPDKCIQIEGLAKIAGVGKEIANFKNSLLVYSYFDLGHISSKISERESVSASSEKTVDPSGIPLLDDIEERFRKIVLTAGARPDLIAFVIKKDDESSKEILKWFGEISSGNQWGRKPILNVNEYSESDRSNALELLERIHDGRIKFNLIEIKTKFSKNKVEPKVTEASQGSGIFAEPRNDKYTDVAHTLWAMYQFVTAIYKISEPREGLDKPKQVILDSLSNGNSDNNWINNSRVLQTETDPDKKMLQLLSVIRFMRPFVDPEKSGNKVILARLYFPLISESVILQSIHPLYGMTTDIGYVQKTQIESRCDVMKPKKLIRRSAVNGRVMAKNVSYDIRRKEMEKKKTDDQKFIDDVNFELSSVEIPEI